MAVLGSFGKRLPEVLQRHIARDSVELLGGVVISTAGQFTSEETSFHSCQHGQEGINPYAGMGLAEKSKDGQNFQRIMDLCIRVSRPVSKLLSGCNAADLCRQMTMIKYYPKPNSYYETHRNRLWLMKRPTSCLRACSTFRNVGATWGYGSSLNGN